MTNTDHNHLQGMKRLLWSVPVLLLTILVAASCSDTDDGVEEYPDWQNYNQTYWNKLYATTQQKIANGDTSWKIIKKWSLEDSLHIENTDYIIAHVIAEGDGTETPLYTDTVRVHYKGKLLPSVSYPNGREFDSTWGETTSANTALPKQMCVGDNVLGDGFTTVLQCMHVGEEWDIFVPWQLASSSSEINSKVPIYSLLLFRVTLVNYHHPGTQFYAY